MASRRNIQFLKPPEEQTTFPPAFLHLLQKALLLALREQERITPMQHRHAEEALVRKSRQS